jgi:predicted TIM-barrel fold metal-dependent hydrolase
MKLHCKHLLRAFALVLFGLLLSVHASRAESAEPENLHIYLLIGQSNMAGRAPVPEDLTGEIERCFLLNAEGQWEPARNPLNRYSSVGKGPQHQRLGPGYSFARKMLEANPDINIGLIVNAQGGTKIEQWLGKSKLYYGIRGRSKPFRDSGRIKGVLWHQGESNSDRPEGYLENLKILIGNLRNDFNDMNLPFVAGQIRHEPHFAINDEIAKLPDEVHLTGVASSEGLTTYDRWHFDSESQLKLGERYAEAMLALQAEREAMPAPQRPSDMKFIDVHVHAKPLDEEGLKVVSDWMDDRRIDKCIISPLDHKGSHAYTEAERQQMIATFAPYKGRIYRMALIEPGDYATAEEAAAYLKKEKADGAVAMGEHYGRKLMFDDPQNLLLYEACDLADLPIMFHIDQNKNMVTEGMPEVDRVLQKFPNVDIVAHAHWWRQYGNGTCDRQLSEYPNLYADVSVSGVKEFNRDRKKAREFIIKHQDQILFGTDEGWWSFNKSWEDNPHYTLFEELDLPDEVRYKIYRGNAIKVYGLGQ